MSEADNTCSDLMRFDDVCVAECVIPNPYLDSCGSGVDIPPLDERCSDPIFAEQNPDLCKYYTRLILKNEYAQAPVLDEVQFRAFLMANGKEAELTEGLTFLSSETGVATIDASTGLATTIAAGITTISVQWNDSQYAFAQLEVVEDCGEIETDFLVLIDNSLSMGQQFNGLFPTKLAFAKKLASDFFQSLNVLKDKAALGIFNEEASVKKTLTISTQGLIAETAKIKNSKEETDLADAIEHGVEYLDLYATDGAHKVLILITDGQQNVGEDPRPLARAFKEEGGIIIVVGVRTFGDYFQVLNEVSSKGFFISAYPAISMTSIVDALDGLQHFVCSGLCPDFYGCVPDPLGEQVADLTWLPVLEE